MYIFIIKSKKHGNFEVIIDEQDKNLVLKYKWSISIKNNGRYAVAETRVSKQELIKLHRLIMGLKKGDKTQVDHINRNPLDNRRSNLRFANQAQNSRNQIQPRGNKWGFIGVYKWQNKFRGCLSVNNRTVHVPGYYDTAEEAARERDKLAYKISGEFAVLNFPLQKKDE